MGEPKEPADLLRDGGSSSKPNSYGGNHETIYDKDRQSHISWDTDKKRDYVPGTGHTVNDKTGETKFWDRR